MDHIYISLGSDCSISYQLQVRNLRHISLPFDWIRINSLDDLIEILDNNFQFFNKNYLEIIRDSDKFPLVDEEWNNNLNKNIILKHKKYNILFPHEISYDIDKIVIDKNIDIMVEKYNRRITRFFDIIKNSKIKKTFIRITGKKEDEKLLYKTLEKISNNFVLKYIYMDKSIKYISWKKEEIDWDALFIKN
jgi:hypothetical protein